MRGRVRQCVGRESGRHAGRKLHAHVQHRPQRVVDPAAAGSPAPRPAPACGNVAGAYTTDTPINLSSQTAERLPRRGHGRRRRLRRRLGVLPRASSASGSASTASPRGANSIVNSYSGGGLATQPDVAMDAYGDFVVTWWGTGSQDANGVYARIFDSAGNPDCGPVPRQQLHPQRLPTNSRRWPWTPTGTSSSRGRATSKAPSTTSRKSTTGGIASPERRRAARPLLRSPPARRS